MSIPTLRSLDLPATKNAGFQRVSFKTLWACVATQTGLKVNTVRCRHTGLKGRLSPRPLRIPGSLLRAAARWADMFQLLPLSTAKCRRLGGTFATGFEP